MVQITTILDILVILMIFTGFIFLISFIFWMIGHYKKDEAYVRFASSKQKEDRIKASEAEELKRLVNGIEIETDAYELEYYIRNKNVKKYRLSTIISLSITIIFFLFMSFLPAIATDIAANTAAKQTSTKTQKEETQSRIFQMPDGSVVSEEDVYLGEDGQYYLKPEITIQGQVDNTEVEE